jgi:hypothetical protein
MAALWARLTDARATLRAKVRGTHPHACTFKFPRTRTDTNSNTHHQRSQLLCPLLIRDNALSHDSTWRACARQADVYADIAPYVAPTFMTLVLDTIRGVRGAPSAGTPACVRLTDVSWGRASACLLWNACHRNVLVDAGLRVMTQGEHSCADSRCCCLPCVSARVMTCSVSGSAP